MILCLELVAFELEADRPPAAEVDLELRERGEQWRRQAVHDRLRPDRRRQDAARPFAARTCAVGPAGDLGGVEDAPADAVVVEGDVRLAVERAGERAVGGSGDLAVRGEVDPERGIDVVRVVPERKSAVGFDELDVRERRRDRAPVPVAHGHEETAQELQVAGGDVAEIRGLELGRERAGGQRLTLDRRRVPAV